MSTIMICGYPLGSVIGALLVGEVCSSPSMGWAVSFYITGGITLAIALQFAIIFHETPHSHPHISEEELKYITEGQESDMTKKSVSVPWKKIFSSVPIYALFSGMFGFYWALTYFMTLHPTFLGTVIHYSMEEVGILSSLPYLAMFLGGIVSSFLSIHITNKNPRTTNIVRKSCSTIRTITSASTTVASIAAAVMPVVGGILTKQETFGEWQNFFYLNISVVAISAIIFHLFGSAELQPWNYTEQKKQIESKENHYNSSTCILNSYASIHI